MPSLLRLQEVLFEFENQVHAIARNSIQHVGRAHIHGVVGTGLSLPAEDRGLVGDVVRLPVLV